MVDQSQKRLGTARTLHSLCMSHPNLMEERKILSLLPLGFTLLFTKGVLLSQLLSVKCFNHQPKKVCVHSDIGG